MPISYTIRADERAVFIRAWGTLREQEVRRGQRVMFGDPRWNPRFVRIADFRDVSEFDMSTAAIRALTSATDAGLAVRRALIAETKVGFGLLRQYQQMTSEAADATLVCHDMPTALEWVGLPGDTAWPADPADAVFDDGTAT